MYSNTTTAEISTWALKCLSRLKCISQYCWFTVSMQDIPAGTSLFSILSTIANKHYKMQRTSLGLLQVIWRLNFPCKNQNTFWPTSSPCDLYMLLCSVPNRLNKKGADEGHHHASPQLRVAVKSNIQTLQIKDGWYLSFALGMMNCTFSMKDDYSLKTLLIQLPFSLLISLTNSLKQEVVRLHISLILKFQH